MAKEIKNWNDLIKYIEGMEIGDSIHIENSKGVFQIIKKKEAPIVIGEDEE